MAGWYFVSLEAGLAQKSSLVGSSLTGPAGRRPSLGARSVPCLPVSVRPHPSRNALEPAGPARCRSPEQHHDPVSAGNVSRDTKVVTCLESGRRSRARAPREV